MSHRQIWRLAWPVIISNISVPLLSAVDTAVVGRLPGARFLAAVAVGGLLFSVMFAGFNFLRMGTTGLTAQAHGAGKMDDVAAWLGRSLVLSLLVALAMLTLQLPLEKLALTLIDAEPEVSKLAAGYFHVRMWAMPAALINVACLGWFFGIHQTRTALWVQIFLNLLNMGLDVLFVLKLNMGIQGAAWATVLSEYVTMALSLYLVTVHLRRQGAHLVLARLWDKTALLRMMRVNRDIFLRSCCLQVAFFSFTAAGARLGAGALAANAVLINLHIFACYGLDGLANVAEILAGNARGAGDARRLRAVIISTTYQSIVVALIFSLAWWLLGNNVIALLTNIAEVRSTAATYLPWLVALPLVSVWCFMLDGVFIGTTHTRAMRNSMAFSLLLYMVLLVALLPSYGNHGLWLAFVLFNICRGITMTVAIPSLLRDTAAEQTGH